MNRILLAIAAGATCLSTVVSCTKKLDLVPTNDITSEQVYSTSAGYRQSFAKIYGSMATTGNSGPAGNKDIAGPLDEGNFTDFFRTFWYAQELTTDEAVLAWGDPGLPDFHNMSWTPTNTALSGLYYRTTYTITLCNEYLRQSTDDKLSSRGIAAVSADSIRKFRPEIRFLRAFNYWVLMDLYGNPPFATEANAIGEIPKQIKRADLFNYIESELKAIDADLPAARSNEYGRADKAAAWSLLARMYLNAQVYTGTPRYADALANAKKVIDAGYTLLSDPRWLLLADNNVNNPEFIFTINYDGLKTQGYGGTTFITHAATGGNMNGSTVTGVGGGWFGLRTTSKLVDLFPDANGTADKRAQFYASGQTKEIDEITRFTDGYAVIKYRNVKRNGAIGQSPDFADIDVPVFRLAEMYLIYAEAHLRGGGGDAATALGYINNLRTRAYQNATGNIAANAMTLDFILDERARELYWEGFRRSDLIRYGRFTEGTYLWPWKGGVKAGRAVEDFRKLFPIPSLDLAANPGLVQNSGYSK